MAEQRVTVTITDAVADVRLNRPEKRNALDQAMFAGLITAGERLKSEPGVRAIVLSGEGPDFCAGLDFGSFEAMRDGRRLSLEVDLPPGHGPAQAAGQRAAYVWTEIPVPVIAAVTGNALGGGLQIALGADIRIVAPDARMSVLEIRWGLVPDMTGTQLLPELVGRDVAKELTLTWPAGWTSRRASPPSSGRSAPSSAVPTRPKPWPRSSRSARPGSPTRADPAPTGGTPSGALRGRRSRNRPPDRAIPSGRGWRAAGCCRTR